MRPLQMDAVIAWSLKPYMDVVMVQKGASYTAYIPLLIVLFTLIQSIFNYIATYIAKVLRFLSKQISPPH